MLLFFRGYTGVDDGDFLLKVGNVGLEALNPALQIAHERFAALGFRRKEAEIVLVCAEVVPASLKDAERMLALAVELVFIAFKTRYILAEIIHPSTRLLKVELVAHGVAGLAVSFVDFVFFAERHMAYFLPPGLKTAKTCECFVAAALER